MRFVPIGIAPREYPIGEWTFDDQSADMVIQASARMNYEEEPVVTVFVFGHPMWEIDPADGEWESRLLLGSTFDPGGEWMASLATFLRHTDASEELYQIWRAEMSWDAIGAMLEDGQGYMWTELKGIIAKAAHKRYPSLFPEPQGF